MRISKIETMSCDAGWRAYYFVKLSTDEGVTGWSEFDEGFGSPGVSQVIAKLAPLAEGIDILDNERVFADLYARTRPAAGGVVGEGIGAIENAILDAKAKALGVPVYALLGGKVRDTVRCYWSHCASYHINYPAFYEPAVRTLDDVKARGAAVRDKGFTALKTNLFLPADGGGFRGWRPGVSAPYYPERNIDTPQLRAFRDFLEALRDGAGPDVDILLDLNFNVSMEGALKTLRMLDDFPLLWVEIDMPSPEALAYVRQHSRHPISSCETLFGGRQLLPYLRNYAVDAAIIDVPWNGIWQSMKMASLAEIHEVNVAPHNFYGHLCTMMAAHFSAAVPNLRIMETDQDRLAWDHEFHTHLPEFRNGHLVVPDRPGWGTEPIEEAIKARPPTGPGFFLSRR
ncbi:MAG: mandelate racemase/muconate lactonizing enzyme family protein [Hyphomicrobiaceae bacterium]